tara:strand:+ start:285 stop:1100 length:816 start_codon:yes stop_codon:yes gene_type:complete
MAKHDFLVKLTHFANTEWPSVKLGHSVGAFDDTYPCANPEGPVDNSDCSDDNPLCNCPCQELNPYKENDLIDLPWWSFGVATGIVEGILNSLLGGGAYEEPTKEQIIESIKSIKECDLIENNPLLGESWMGCLWKDQNHPSSCNCPCVGEDFKKYIEYSRTSATYWDTPTYTPLWRDAQMMLIKSQQAVIMLNGDLTLRPGELINITNKNVGSDKERRMGGRWLVAEIHHNIIRGGQHKMLITLVRDSSPIDPETSEYLGLFGEIWNWISG